VIPVITAAVSIRLKSKRLSPKGFYSCSLPFEVVFVRPERQRISFRLSGLCYSQRLAVVGEKAFHVTTAHVKKFPSNAAAYVWSPNSGT
jgi:hypothetical protein